MKQLLLLPCMALMTLNSISQDSRSQSDSITCLPNYQLRIAALNIERGKLAMAERDACRDSLKLMYSKSFIKDSIIGQFRFKDITQSKLNESLREELKIADRQKELALESLKKAQKLYKRQKFKTYFCTGAGIILGVIVSGLLIK